MYIIENCMDFKMFLHRNKCILSHHFSQAFLSAFVYSFYKFQVNTHFDSTLKYITRAKETEAIYVSPIEITWLLLFETMSASLFSS